MSDEIHVGAELYISSRRASEITGYSRDYIGQLARKGDVGARRIGGLWYVLEKALLAYKREAEAFKPEPPRNAKYREDLEMIVSFDGKEYLSAPKAAEITGYHQDYVGQLAREEKVASRQIGTRWYVEREGIVAHKKHKDALLAAVQAEAVGIRPRKPLETDASSISYTGAGPYMTYTRDEGDLLPVIADMTHLDSVSREGEEPRSARISLSHSIPIRKMDVQQSVKVMTSSHNVDRGKNRRSVSGSRLSVAVATIVIVVVIGYVSFQSSAVYTQSDAKNESFAIAAYAADVFTAIGDFIEDIVASEVTYSRQN